MEINVKAVRLAMVDKGMTAKQLAKAAHISEYTAAQRHAYNALQDRAGVGRQAVQFGAG